MPDAQPSKIKLSKAQSSITKSQLSKKQQSKSMLSRLQSDEIQSQKVRTPKGHPENTQSMKLQPAGIEAIEKSLLDTEYDDFDLYEKSVKSSRSGKFVRRKRSMHNKKSSVGSKRQNQKKN